MVSPSRDSRGGAGLDDDDDGWAAAGTAEPLDIGVLVLLSSVGCGLGARPSSSSSSRESARERISKPSSSWASCGRSLV